MRRRPGSLAGRYGRGAAFATVGVAFAALAAGCSSGDAQDAGEPKGSYKVDVISATFPGRQRLAEKSKLTITVKNTGSETIPNLAVTLDGLDTACQSDPESAHECDRDPNLADPERPIWILNRPPYSSVTAYTNTYSVGKLDSGKVRSMRWSVTAVQHGTYTVRYRVAAGLNGKAKAVQADGTPATGSFLVKISSVPRPVANPLK